MPTPAPLIEKLLLVTRRVAASATPADAALQQIRILLAQTNADAAQVVLDAFKLVIEARGAADAVRRQNRPVD